jgi:hypothetical protein
VSEFIINLIVRWGFVTAPILAKVDPRGTSKVWNTRLSRLERAGRIKSFKFRGRQLYYVLTSYECKHRGLHRKRSRPFGSQSLITRLGQMLFCLERGLQKKTRAEVEAQAPELQVRGLCADRYVPLPDRVLGLMVSDCGARASHIANKVLKEVERRRAASEAWREILRLRGLKVIIIVGDAGKGARIGRRLADKGFDFEVVVIDELGPFILGETK